MSVLADHYYGFVIMWSQVQTIIIFQRTIVNIFLLIILNICFLQFKIFSNPSFLTYVLAAPKNHPIETDLLSTNNICFGLEIGKLFVCYTFLTF